MRNAVWFCLTICLFFVVRAVVIKAGDVLGPALLAAIVLTGCSGPDPWPVLTRCPNGDTITIDPKAALWVDGYQIGRRPLARGVTAAGYCASVPR